MSNFGFSAGDIVAAVSLLRKIAVAFDDSNGARNDFNNLRDRLQIAEKILLQVHSLEVESRGRTEVEELYRATARLQQTVERFFDQHLKKYEPYLQEKPSACSKVAKAKGGYAKLKWSILKKEDLEKFRNDLQTELALITFHLMVIQVDSMSLRENKREDQQRALTAQIRAASALLMTGLNFIVKNMERGFQEISKAIVAASTIHTQHQTQILSRIELLLTRPSAPVGFEEPVHLFDALGRYRPFHLEFIQSTESLITIIRHNFMAAGVDLGKSNSRRFVFEDATTKHFVDIRKAWQLCFHPGQRVLMSAVLEIHDFPYHLIYERSKRKKKCHVKRQSTNSTVLECMKNSFNLNVISKLEHSNELTLNAYQPYKSAANESELDVQRPEIAGLELSSQDFLRGDDLDQEYYKSRAVWEKDRKKYERYERYRLSGHKRGAMEQVYPIQRDFKHARVETSVATGGRCTFLRYTGSYWKRVGAIYAFFYPQAGRRKVVVLHRNARLFEDICAVRDGARNAFLAKNTDMLTLLTEAGLPGALIISQSCDGIFQLPTPINVEGERACEERETDPKTRKVAKGVKIKFE